MKALYELKHKIAGFDFFPWLVMQREAGATGVVFDISSPKTDKFTANEVAKRYQSILRPGPALAGMESFEGTDGQFVCKGGQQALVDFCKRGGKFPRLKSVLPPGNERYTVTLRTTRRWPNRNSREAEWRTFAAEI